MRTRYTHIIYACMHRHCNIRTSLGVFSDIAIVLIRTCVRTYVRRMSQLMLILKKANICVARGRPEIKESSTSCCNRTHLRTSVFLEAQRLPGAKKAQKDMHVCMHVIGRTYRSSYYERKNTIALKLLKVSIVRT